MKRALFALLACWLAIQVSSVQGQIDQLASNNPAPEIQRGRKPPIYADGYDWDEQDRVWRAFVQCARDAREESWEELLKHLDDKRYAITIKPEHSFTENYSVGQLCRELAMYRVCTVLERRSTTTLTKHWPVVANPGIANLAEWRAKRAGKKLVELQIEAAELGLKKVGDLHQLSAEQRTEMSRGIEADIRYLSNSKVPFFSRFPLGLYEPIEKPGEPPDD